MINAGAATLDDVYEISPADSEIPTEWNSGAVYALDTPVRCPYCSEPIKTVRVVSLTRAQAPFMSTLPRRGRVVICTECERILSAELSGVM